MLCMYYITALIYRYSYCSSQMCFLLALYLTDYSTYWLNSLENINKQLPQIHFLGLQENCVGTGLTEKNNKENHNKAIPYPLEIFIN